MSEPRTIAERELAERFFDAARAGDAEGLRAWFERAWPWLEGSVRAVLARRRPLLARARLLEEDVAQHVALALLRRPPTNSQGRPPEAVLRAWAAQVAVRYVLDAVRRSRTDPIDEDAPDGRSDEAARLDARESVRRLLECAGKLPARYAQAFRMFADDPDTGALELAERLGLYPSDPALDEAERERRARTNAWAVRSRTLRWLERCMRGAEVA